MSAPKTVLIVDDETGIRSAMANALSLRGHRAFVAAGLEQAEPIVRETPVEIVLTDLRLEGDDGVRVVEALRRIRPQIRPIFMTGYGSLQSAIQAIRLGAVDYLTKPFRMEELVAAIEKTRPASEEVQPFRADFPWSREAEATPEAASALLLEAAALLRTLGLEENARGRTLSALAEAIQNVLRHAYPGNSGRIQASLQLRGGRLTGRVADQGKGFNGGGIVAEALTRRDGRLGGLRYLQQSVDDLRVTSAPGKGCAVEFFVNASFTQPEGRLRLPPIPLGIRWGETVQKIRDGVQDLTLDFQDLEFLHPNAAAELREALNALRKRGGSANFENCRLPSPIFRALLEEPPSLAETPAEDSTLIRQALWA